MLSPLKTRNPYYTYSFCNPPFQLYSSPNSMSFLLRNVDGAIMAWNNGDNNAQKTIWFITSYCLFVILISTQICTEKICIKYSKHWKGYVSFQLSGQIGLIWAVKKYSPTSSSCKTYDINYPNQKKFGSLIFKPKKRCWF